MGEPIQEEQVLLLPGKLFFVESVNIPEELEVSEIPDFVELSLESIAPFPVEQLYWGYLYDKDAPNLLLYAAHRERIKSEGFSNLDNYLWVLPDFATLSGASFHQDTLVLLEGGESVSLAYFEGNRTLSEFAWVDSTTEPLSDDLIRGLTSSISGLPKTAPMLILRPTTVTLSEKGLPTFTHDISEHSSEQSYDGKWKTLGPTESQLWQMDVRALDFKIAEKSKRRMGSIIARIATWAAVFALLVLGVEGALFASQAWLKTQLDQVERQQDAVSKVEEKQVLVNKLEKVAQNELRPIEMLEAANDVRLKLSLGIEYDSVVIEDENHITVEGKASSINALNQYVDGLKNSGLFELLSEQNPITRNGKTTFKVSLAYESKVIPVEESANTEENATAILKPLKIEEESI